MPIPNAMRQVNRKALNPVMARFAGRIPPFAIIVHTGRSSGKVRSNPIMAFPTKDGFAVALTYGRGTDWERNVLAANACELRYRNRTYELVNPRVITDWSSLPLFPAPVAFALRRLHVDNVMLLDSATP